jgi:hypothetical protein
MRDDRKRADQVCLWRKRYNSLPQPIRDIYNEREWLWLSDFEKHNLIKRETEPEITEP